MKFADEPRCSQCNAPIPRWRPRRSRVHPVLWVALGYALAIVAVVIAVATKHMVNP